MPLKGDIGHRGCIRLYGHTFANVGIRVQASGVIFWEVLEMRSLIFSDMFGGSLLIKIFITCLYSFNARIMRVGATKPQPTDRNAFDVSSR